jgi:hypothetical protein
VTASNNHNFRKRSPRFGHTSIQSRHESVIRLDESTSACLGVEHQVAMPLSSIPIPLASDPTRLSVVPPP